MIWSKPVAVFFLFNGNLLKWLECFGQFKSAVDTVVFQKKTVVSGKAKTAIAEFS